MVGIGRIRNVIAVDFVLLFYCHTIGWHLEVHHLVEGADGIHEALHTVGMGHRLDDLGRRRQGD